MKRILILSALASALLTSCFDIETGSENDSLIEGFTTCFTDSAGHICVLKDDFGGQYMVKDNDFEFKKDSECRLVCTYTIDDQNLAEIKSYNVPYTQKPVYIYGIKKSERIWDPLQVESGYIGSGYLNMVLIIKVGSEDSKHYFLPVIMDSDNDEVLLSFIHDAGDDKPYYTKKALISIPLDGLGLQKNDTVFFTCHGYEEDCNMKFLFR